MNKVAGIMKVETTFISAVIAAVATVLAALISSTNLPRFIKWIASLIALGVVLGAIAFIVLVFARPEALCSLGIDLGESCGPPITGTYRMDSDPGRIITISHISGAQYQIGEATSPWPWTGTAMLNGDSLVGECQFMPKGDWMRVEGNLRPNGSIEVNYVFLTGPGGSPTGRIDHHFWNR